MTAKGANFFAFEIPELYGFVPTGGGNRLTVWAKFNLFD